MLFLSNPPGVDSGVRRRQLDLLGWMNSRHYDRVGDPEIRTRIEAFELGYGMQSSVPGLMDISKEPQSVHELYGTKPGQVSFPITASWPGGWWSRGYAACSSTTQAGTSTGR